MLPAAWLSQEPLLGDYIADFYHPQYMVVIEADGGYHTPQAQRDRDAVRDRAMAAAGISVLRFTNTQILRQARWVSQCIDRTAIAACATRGLPTPVAHGATAVRLSAEQRRARRQKRLNGGKRSYHVIPERRPEDE